MTARHATLFLIGVALSIAQFVMIRDFVSILYGEEVVIVLVTSTFFLGLSVGYLLSLRMSPEAFRWLFLASIFIHLSFPFSYRVLASWFADWDLGGLSFLALLVVYALIFNLVFAENKAANHLWHKLGFQDLGVIPGAVRKNDGSYQDAIIMFRSLV